MSKIAVSKHFDAHANSLWSTVGKPESLGTWHPAIVSSEMSNDGVKRTVTLADGAVLNEEIMSHNDDERAYTYRIVGGPLPVEGYISTIRVKEANGGCTVTWESEFAVAPGAPVDEVEDMLRGVYQAGLDAL